MHTCPHCEERGVGFFAKLLSNPALPAKCERCGRFSTKCARTVWLQLALGIAFLAVVPNVVTDPPLVKQLGVVAAVVIILVGQLAPLCQTVET